MRRGCGMPLIVGAGVGGSYGVKVGDSPGGGEYAGGGVGVINAAGGPISMSSVCVAALYVTAAPRARATAASGIIGAPARRYGAMGNLTATAPATASREPTEITSVRPACINVTLPASPRTIVVANARAYGSSGAVTTP